MSGKLGWVGNFKKLKRIAISQDAELAKYEMSLIGPKELQHFNYMRELCTLLNMCAKLLNRSKQTTGKNILAAEFGFSVMIRDQRNTASFALLASRHFRSVYHQHLYTELSNRSTLNLTKHG